MGVGAGTTSSGSKQSYVTVTEVGSSAPVDLALPQDNRVAFVIFNTSGVLYVLCGEGTATADHWTYRLTSNCTLENTWWKGKISVLKEAGSSMVRSSIYLGD